MTRYEPELGQAVFGNPTGYFSCPPLLLAAIRYLDEEMGRIIENRGQKYYSPLANLGTAYQTDVFTMRAYYWGDIEEKKTLPNFFWQYQGGRLEMRWYKYFGRGTSVDQLVTPLEIETVLEESLRSLSSLREIEP